MCQMVNDVTISITHCVRKWEHRQCIRELSEKMRLLRETILMVYGRSGSTEIKNQDFIVFSGNCGSAFFHNRSGASHP